MASRPLPVWNKPQCCLLSKALERRSEAGTEIRSHPNSFVVLLLLSSWNSVRNKDRNKRSKAIYMDTVSILNLKPSSYWKKAKADPGHHGRRRAPETTLRRTSPQSCHVAAGCNDKAISHWKPSQTNVFVLQKSKHKCGKGLGGHIYHSLTFPRWRSRRSY